MQARYLIGTDWNRKSYVVGLGKKGYDHTVHRGASCPAAQDAEGNPVPCPPDTRGSNRPDVNEITGGVLWLPEVRALPPRPPSAHSIAHLAALQTAHVCCCAVLCLDATARQRPSPHAVNFRAPRP